MGRPKGGVNAANKATKIAWAHFCANNIDKFQTLFDKIEKQEGAAAALKMLLEISKYAAPVARDGEVESGGIVINVTTGIPGPPNSLKPVTDGKGNLLLTDDGKPMYEQPD